MVVRHVTKALPEVIKKAEQTYRDLKPKLALVRQREKEKRRIEGLRGKSEALQEKLRMLASWYSSVVPLSTTYAELADRWAVVEDQLKSSEAAYKEAMLESSDAREEDLLRVKVK
jgi:seryl-tRNA synthetase